MSSEPYDLLFGRARAHARSNPSPTLYLDVCGYDYSLAKQDAEFVCAGCGRAARAVKGVTGSAHVAVTDMDRAFGRRHVPLGIVCDMDCAELAMKGYFNQ